MKNANRMLKEFLQSKARSNYSKNTIKSYYNDISQFHTIVGNRLKNGNVKKFVDYLYSINQSTTSIKHKLSVVRNYLKFCGKPDVSGNDIHVKTEKKVPQCLSDVEIGLIRHECMSDRDLLIIDFLYTTGVRISELCGIRVSDINNCEVLIHGKGNKQRVVYITEDLNDRIQDFCKLHGLDDYIFIGYKGNHISSSMVWRMLNGYAKRAGIQKRVYPHILRHSFATRMLKNGANLPLIQKLMGHSNISSTQIYLHVESNKDEFLKLWENK